MAGERIESQRYGAVLFDDPEAVERGWACVSGQDPFYVSSTGDLYSNTIWLTNVDLQAFYKKGLSKSPRLRPDSFLRTRVSSLLIELGLRYVEPREQSRSLAELFSIVMQFGFYHLGISSAPVGALNNGIRQVTLPEEQALPLYVKEAAEYAVQPHVICEKKEIEDNSELISLVFNRYGYALSMLEHRLPIGKWQRDRQFDFSSGAGNIVSKLEHSNKPALIRVDIRTIDISINHLVNYGSGAGMKTFKSHSGSEAVTFNQRAWMTTPEFVFLSKYTEMEVKDVLVGEGYGINPLSVPAWGHYSEHSYAFGLYCENLWTALTRTLDGRSAKTPLSAWVHSVDRLRCLEKAMQIDCTENVTVHGYGYGRVTLQMTPASRGIMPDLALRQKMIAPMNDVAQAKHRPLPQPATHTDIMQIAMERGAIDFIERTNNAAIEAVIELYRQKAEGRAPGNLLEI